jgi:hypothetical protein
MINPTPDPTDPPTPDPTVDPPTDPAAPDPNAPEPDPNNPDPDGTGGNSEAAKYRRRLRDAEAQRDTLATRVQTYQRREVEALAQGKLAVPGDVFAIGQLSLEDAYDPSGELRADVVETAIDELLRNRPGLAVPRDRRNWGQGGGRPPVEGGATWGDVLNPKS